MAISLRATTRLLLLFLGRAGENEGIPIKAAEGVAFAQAEARRRANWRSRPSPVPWPRVSLMFEAVEVGVNNRQLFAQALGSRHCIAASGRVKAVGETGEGVENGRVRRAVVRHGWSQWRPDA